MKGLVRWLGPLLVALLALQVFFVARIAIMAVMAPGPPVSSAPEGFTRIANNKGTLRAGANSGWITARFQAT